MDRKKEVKIKTSEGEKTYTLHKWNALDGRYISFRYYDVKEDAKNLTEEKHKSAELASLKIMSYISININGVDHRLNSIPIINTYIPDYQVQLQLELLSIEFNTSFLKEG